MARSALRPAGAEALLALGSNLEPARHLPAAVALLAEQAEVVGASSAWATAPVGPPGQLPFVNAAVLLRTPLPPARLKAELLRPLERRLGRRRSSDRFAPRQIDIDLVWHRDGRTPEEGLTGPDPDLLRHAHIALPASEVAGSWVHPETGETLAEIADRLLGALSADQRPRRLPLLLAPASQS